VLLNYIKLSHGLNFGQLREMTEEKREIDHGLLKSLAHRTTVCQMQLDLLDEAALFLAVAAFCSLVALAFWVNVYPKLKLKCRPGVKSGQHTD
jgi:hypothetical protein